jgi:sulfate transport system ATP-binding protein
MTLQLSHLHRRYGGFAALDDVSLRIEPGEFLALLGPSGSGKTTLLRILAGLDYPDSGSVRQGDRDLLTVDARERKVGLVFQHYALFRHLTVSENVAFGLRIRPRKSRPSRAEIDERVGRLLKRVQLDDLGKRYTSQLSGGQRQRVALARALAVEPDLLLLDEPFGALDAQVRVALRRWLRNLHEELGLTSVFVTHDQEEALELADRVAVMNRGRIEQIGTPEAIYQQPGTPFVCEFIGKTNKIPLQRANGVLTGGQRRLGADPWPGNAVGSAIGYVRPEHLLVSSTSSPNGWAAQLRHIYLAGGVAHLELDVPALGQVLEADMSSDEVAQRGLQPGQSLFVQPRLITAFPLDARGEADAAARHVLQPQVDSQTEQPTWL